MSLVWLSAFLGGCGYRFSGQGDFTGGIETLHVRVFENRTADAAAAVIFTNDLIYEITRRRAVTVTSAPEAEATLTGVITGVHADTVSRKSASESLERRLRAAVDLKITDRKGNVVWSASGVTAEETYDVSGGGSVSDQGRRAALIRLSKRLAENMYNRLLDDF